MPHSKIRIDLHVHSKFSTRPSQWILQKIGCPESFADPVDIYRIAREKGMTLVTITDHNRIDGALEIAHLPDTFISEEITTYFPEDHCKVHVLAWHITESQHDDIQKIRENIFDLVAYLTEAGITHAVAHPTYGINDKLTVDHFEKMLLLFKNVELNGSRNDESNICLGQVLSKLTAADIQQLANKHDLAPTHDEPWKKTLVGGSDDHSALNIARNYTEIEGINTVESALAGIHSGKTHVVRNPATPLTLAHVLYSIAYQFYRNKFRLDRYTNKDTLLNFLDRSLTTHSANGGPGLMAKLYCFWNYRRRKSVPADMPDSLAALLRQETAKLLHDNPQLSAITENKALSGQPLEKNWFDFVTQVSNGVLSSFANRLMDHVSGANFFNILQTVGSAAGLYSMMAPYFISFAHFVKDKSFNVEMLRRFNVESPIVGSSNVAYFTDTFFDINDIAITLQQHVKSAIHNEKEITVITCDDQNRESAANIKTFKPVGVYELPDYDGQTLYFPPLMEMLHYCYENNVSRIHAATPGPIGLAGLIVAHILKLPISATYYTSLPLYAQMLTDDPDIEELTWKFVLWYYAQMDVIYVPTKSVKQELTRKGIRSKKIVVFPNVIDTTRFHPQKRNGFLLNRYNIRSKIKLLCVGQISKSKNLHVLADVFKALAVSTDNIHLIVVGDGSYANEMKFALRHTPCTFTGYLSGEDLAAVYASSDIFVFPSTTDTLGRAVLEAQASGLPAIVSDQGGPHDNVIPGETGLVVKGNDTINLLNAILTLISDPHRIRQMGHAARKYVEDRCLDTAFFDPGLTDKSDSTQAASPLAEAV